MKTIKELRDEGLMSGRTYRALFRGIDWEFMRSNPYMPYQERHELIHNVTVEYIFEHWTEAELLKFRNFGAKALEELKGLL